MCPSYPAHSPVAKQVTISLFGNNEFGEVPIHNKNVTENYLGWGNIKISSPHRKSNGVTVHTPQESHGGYNHWRHYYIQTNRNQHYYYSQDFTLVVRG